QDYADIQRIVKQSILIVLVISAVAMYLFNHATPLLHFLKADAALQALIVSCLWLLAWTIPAHLLLRILYILTQACGQAKRVFYA
ncbi:MATE family efflux transporter, partial [Yersinia pestis]